MIWGKISKHDPWVSFSPACSRMIPAWMPFLLIKSMKYPPWISSSERRLFSSYTLVIKHIQYKYGYSLIILQYISADRVGNQWIKYNQSPCNDEEDILGAALDGGVWQEVLSLTALAPISPDKRFSRWYNIKVKNLYVRGCILPSLFARIIYYEAKNIASWKFFCCYVSPNFLALIE